MANLPPSGQTSVSLVVFVSNRMSIVEWKSASEAENSFMEEECTIVKARCVR